MKLDVVLWRVLIQRVINPGHLQGKNSHIVDGIESLHC
jgi:hypothetical protein